MTEIRRQDEAEAQAFTARIVAAKRASISIDFGTTNSAVTFFDEQLTPQIVHSPDSGERTRATMVYYGYDEPSVCDAAKAEYDRSFTYPEAVREEMMPNFVRSLKTRLQLNGKEPLKSPAGTHYSRPHVEIVAEILRHLKEEAEILSKQKATRLVLTHPVKFDSLQKEALQKAARLSGFEEVTLLEEPVAAALGYAQATGEASNGVLVYDFGGGTFDSAFVHWRNDGSFHAIAFDGDKDCGGNDIDQTIYDYIEKQAALAWPTMPESALAEFPSKNTTDSYLLNACRQAKETLSRATKTQVVFTRSYGKEGSKQAIFKIPLDRQKLEQLILPQIEKTMKITAEVKRKAEQKTYRIDGEERHYKVDTLVLIGNSSQIPLVQRMLHERFPNLHIPSMKNLDIAVALGAACVMPPETVGELTIAERARRYRGRISAGEEHTVVLQADRTVKEWGGINIKSEIPTEIVQIVASRDFTVALQSNGNTYIWGHFNNNEAPIPIDLQWNGNPVQIAAGLSHIAVLFDDGTVAVFGNNEYSEDFNSLEDCNVVQIAAGSDFTMVLQADGRVGVYGDIDTVAVPDDLNNVEQIAAHDNMCTAIKSDGKIVVWGESYCKFFDEDNMLHDAMEDMSNIPDDLIKVEQIALGSNFVLALQSDGAVRAWGWNDDGQCDVPTGLKGVVQIAAGDKHAVALKSDGTVIAWGKGECFSDVTGSLLTWQEAKARFDRSTSIQHRVYTIIKEHFGTGCSLSTSFSEDLGADSLDCVELIMAFEEEFSVEIPDEEAEKFERVVDVINYLQTHA